RTRLVNPLVRCDTDHQLILSPETSSHETELRQHLPPTATDLRVFHEHEAVGRALPRKHAAVHVVFPVLVGSLPGSIEQPCEETAMKSIGPSELSGDSFVCRTSADVGCFDNRVPPIADSILMLLGLELRLGLEVGPTSFVKDHGGRRVKHVEAA